MRLDTLYRFLEATAAHGGEPLASIAAFAGSKPSTARRALPTLEELDLVKYSEDATGYSLSRPGVTRGASQDELAHTIRDALLRHRGFGLICAGLSYGESEAESVRKAGVVLKLPRGERGSLNTLVAWGVELGLLERPRAGVLTLKSTLVAATPDDLDAISPDALESQAKIRLYISRRLGRPAVAALDEVDRSLLEAALSKYASHPADAVEDAGKALENFLRELSTGKGYAAEAVKCNGAGQLASLLRGKGLIHNNHLHWVNALSALRNTSGHSKDKSTRVPWTVIDDTAFWAVSATLSTIRSIVAFVESSKQII